MRWGPGSAEGLLEGGGQVLGRLGPGGGHAHARGERHEVEGGPDRSNIAGRPRPGALGRRRPPGSARCQDGVGAVGEAPPWSRPVPRGLGPQRLQRVHGAAVGLEAQDRADPAGDGRPGGLTGSPKPMARRSGEPVVAGGARGGSRDTNRPVVLPSSARRSPPRAAGRRWREATASAVKAPVAALGRSAAWRTSRSAVAPRPVGQLLQGGDRVSSPGPARAPRIRRAPGRSACRDRRRTTPGALASTSTRWRTPSSCAGRTPPGSPGVRPRRSAGATLEAGGNVSHSNLAPFAVRHPTAARSPARHDAPPSSSAPVAGRRPRKPATTST